MGVQFSLGLVRTPKWMPRVDVPAPAAPVVLRPAPAPAPALVPVPAPALAGGAMDELRGLFDRAAAAGLKRPAISVQSEGVALRLSRAPDSGRNPGAIYVRVGDEYAGKVLRSGGFVPDRSCPEGVESALRAFACDPAGVAGASGRETGACSFCSRELTDERSVSVGYGPVCADRYGLAWG